MRIRLWSTERLLTNVNSGKVIEIHVPVVPSKLQLLLLP